MPHADKTYTANSSVMEDGTVVGICSAQDRRIQHLTDGVIEGLDPFSIKVIEKYDLNSIFEINIRKNIFALAVYEKFNNGRKSPINNFIVSLNEIASLNRNSRIHADNIRNLLRRTLYANIITSLETFLSDFLIASVIENNDCIKGLGEKYQDFKKEKYSLDDLISRQKNPLELVVEKLQNIVFHNFNTAGRLYEAAFNISFPKLGSLVLAVKNRHDIIHRNGKK